MTARAPWPQRPEEFRPNHLDALAPDTGAVLLLTLNAVYAALSLLDVYAAHTDSPEPKIVDASDLLETAHDKLAEVAKGMP